MRKVLILLSVFLAFSISAMAQQTVVTGKVVDEEGLPLPGTSIQEKGVSNGTITGTNGDYSLRVGENATLVFSFLGFTTQEIPVGRQNVINVTLVSSSMDIDEVVVTALGIKRDARALGYATSTIKGEDIVVAGNSVNPLTSLYGKAAGVGIQSNIGGPTGGINIKIRGAAGLESSSNVRPLFVVDGVPIYDTESDMSSRGYDPLNSFDYGAGINDINPEDIESMEILKGAKASVLYGSLGANGVILITTKSGKRTRGLGVTVSYQHMFEKPHSYIDWQNEYGSGSSVDEFSYGDDGIREIVSSRYNFGPKFNGEDIRFYDGSISPYQAYPDNFNDLFRTGSSDNISVAIAGGNEKGSMRAAYTHYKYNGIMDNFWQEKNSLSFNGKMNVSDFASLEFISNLYFIDTHNRLGNIQDIVAWGVHRDYDYNKLKALYRTEDGYFNREFYDDSGLPSSSKSLMNLWWSQNMNDNLDKKVHNITSIRATLRFTDWLYFVGQAGVDYTNIDYINKHPKRYKDEASGKYYFSRQNYFIQNYEGFLNFEKSFGKYKIHAFAGPSYRSSSDNTVGVSTYGGLLYPGWYSLTNGVGWPTQSSAGNVRWHSRGSDVIYSVSGAATLSYNDTFYLEFQARNDWSSTLPESNNSYFYPGVSFTWNFTDNFSIPHVNYGKFRASFADVGRPASRYYALKTYSIENLPLNAQILKVQGPNDLFAGDLKPERKREAEFGFNVRMFEQNRLETDFAFYTNNVYDQIMGVPLSATVGAQNIRINAGNVHNWGWELYIKYAPIIGRNYRWDITFTSANQYQKVIKLYDGISQKTLGGGGYSVIAKEGERYGDIWMFDYLRDDNGNRIINDNGLYALDQTEMKPTGKNINPDFIGGLTTSFSWKNLNIYIGLDYKFGGSIFSYSNYYLMGLGSTKNTLKYRDEEHGGLAYYIDNDNKKIPWEHNKALPSGLNNNTLYHNGMVLDGVRWDAKSNSYVENDIIASSSSYYSSYMSDMSDAFQPDALYKNDYIKLREVAISYTLPKAWSQKIKMEKITAQLIARNLFYLYKTLPNVDAESAVGTSGANSYMEKSFYPTARTYGFGLTVSF